MSEIWKVNYTYGYDKYFRVRFSVFWNEHLSGPEPKWMTKFHAWSRETPDVELRGSIDRAVSAFLVDLFESWGYPDLAVYRLSRAENIFTHFVCCEFGYQSAYRTFCGDLRFYQLKWYPPDSYL